jgi:hypothetical protein
LTTLVGQYVPAQVPRVSDHNRQSEVLDDLDSLAEPGKSDDSEASILEYFGQHIAQDVVPLKEQGHTPLIGHCAANRT